MFSQTNDKNKLDHLHNVGKALCEEFATLVRENARPNFIDFYKKLYLSRTENPYWEEIYEALAKKYSQESLDFFEAYLALLANPTKAQWKLFDARWIAQKNLSPKESGINVVSKTRSLLAMLALIVNENENDPVDFNLITVGFMPRNSSNKHPSDEQAIHVEEFAGKEVLDMAVKEVLQLVSFSNSLIIKQALAGSLNQSKKEQTGKEKNKVKEKEMKKNPTLRKI